jgi:hypothetical protein
VQVGDATVSTTAGKLDTHDVAVEQAIRQLHGTLRSGGVGGGHTSAIVNLYIGGDADIGKVADVLDRTVGTRVHSRLRSAGVRGT